MDIQYLLFLQELREATGHVLDGLFLTVTEFGSSTMLVVAISLFYWCVDKKTGVFMALSGIPNVLINNAIKVTACVNRPWIRDARVQPLAKAMEKASGYSFPSGHTTIAVSEYGGMAVHGRKKWPALFWVGIVLAVLVAFSRNYVGVHTPQDVLVAAVQASVIIWLMFRVEAWLEKNPDGDRIVAAVIAAAAILLAAYSYFKSYPLEFTAEGVLLVDPEELREDSFAAAGLSIGFAVGWLLERRYIRFSVDGTLMQRVVRMAVGAAVMLVVKKSLEALFALEFSGVLEKGFPPIFLMIYVMAGYPWLFQKLEPLMWKKRG